MKKRDHINSLLVVITIVVSLTLLGSCMCTSKHKDLLPTNEEWDSYLEMCRPRAEQERLAEIEMRDTVKFKQWLECSANEGDYGCDSCWVLIFGYSLEFKETNTKFDTIRKIVSLMEEVEGWKEMEKKRNYIEEGLLLRQQQDKE